MRYFFLPALSNLEGKTLAVASDAQGNTSALYAMEDASLAATYEYGPFGEPLRVSGAFAEVNPFRFSTKYEDPETGWLYYGYRYYTPATGRWASQDPIGEAGGINLYGFVFNDPVNLVDPLGLETVVLYGEDYLRGDPYVFEYHARAWAKNSGIKDIIIAKGSNTDDWNKALNNVTSVDQIVFVGHSGTLAGPSRTFKGIGVDFQKVIDPKFSPNASITLYGCYTGTTSPEDTTNSAARAAERFNVPAIGTTSGLSFGRFWGLISPGFMRKGGTLWDPVTTTIHYPEK